MQDKYTPDQVISIYGAHDASVTFIDKNKNLRVYEYERFVKKRYALYSSRYDNRHDNGSNNEERINFINLVKYNLFNPDIKLILHLELSPADIQLLQQYFPDADFKLMKHHFSHAASGYFSSKFSKSLIFSVDGGGRDDHEIYNTRVYLGEADDIHTLPCVNYDFGNPYSGLGYLISEIKGGDHGIKDIHSLSNAGKIMGLCAYGEVRQDWISHFESYYDTNNLYQLCNDIDIPPYMNSVSGKTSYDIAATSQYVFEKNMDKLILPFIEQYNTNVVLVGGCALNVLYNQKLYERL
jgi:predicted NodU family carbamoyl transferase